jgi:hypothetical protein
MPAFVFAARLCVFPPEPPVAIPVWPERRGGVKGAPQFGAAKRTLDGEHRSGIDQASTGGVGGNTFPLVSSEPRSGKNGDSKGERNRRFRSPLVFGTAGPMTAQQHTRRLITLIFAGRNRMVMIRRELPRTKRAGWVRKPYRIKHRRVLLFVGPCAVTGSAVQ